MLTTLYSLHSNSCSTAAIQFEFVLRLANSRVCEHLRVHLRVPPIALLLPPRTAFERTHTLPPRTTRAQPTRTPPSSRASKLAVRTRTPPQAWTRGLPPPPRRASFRSALIARTPGICAVNTAPHTPHSAYIAVFEHTHTERPLPRKSSFNHTPTGTTHAPASNIALGPAGSSLRAPRRRRPVRVCTPTALLVSVSPPLHVCADAVCALRRVATHIPPAHYTTAPPIARATAACVDSGPHRTPNAAVATHILGTLRSHTPPPTRPSRTRTPHLAISHARPASHAPQCPAPTRRATARSGRRTLAANDNTPRAPTLQISAQLVFPPPRRRKSQPSPFSPLSLAGSHLRSATACALANAAAPLSNFPRHCAAPVRTHCPLPFALALLVNLPRHRPRALYPVPLHSPAECALLAAAYALRPAPHTRTPPSPCPTVPPHHPHPPPLVGTRAHTYTAASHERGPLPPLAFPPRAHRRLAPPLRAPSLRAQMDSGALTNSPRFGAILAPPTAHSNRKRRCHLRARMHHHRHRHRGSCPYATPARVLAIRTAHTHPRSHELRRRALQPPSRPYTAVPSVHRRPVPVHLSPPPPRTRTAATTAALHPHAPPPPASRDLYSYSRQSPLQISSAGTPVWQFGPQAPRCTLLPSSPPPSRPRLHARSPPPLTFPPRTARIRCAALPARRRRLDLAPARTNRMTAAPSLTASSPPSRRVFARPVTQSHPGGQGVTVINLQSMNHRSVAVGPSWCACAWVYARAPQAHACHPRRRVCSSGSSPACTLSNCTHTPYLALFWVSFSSLYKVVPMHLNFYITNGEKPEQLNLFHVCMNKEGRFN
ncbi:hypothetical protein C8F04DRAFT_1256804 [Mycena alexandri]|uniref:Uncharacterized protein n=1 Tax=Mycena alexandri TaxID=1745969 RepID=A0AAD6T2G9_9AGAR|nr:hypothetical protein C8F04DRAFT_1256804 [Mycena alexandri]